jgi:arylsulfatase A-like enzyme
MLNYPKLSLVLSALALAVTCTSTAFSAEGKRPNLIVILADDLGYADVGFHGCKDIPTPSLDRLSASGTVCSSGYVTYATCAPSRAGLLTGRYPQRFGFERNTAYQPSNPTTGLAAQETTLAAALRPVGYKSGLVGKWHLGAHDNFHPLNRGFDEFYGHIGGGKRYFPEDLTLQTTLDARNEPDSYRTLITRGFAPVKTSDYLTEEFTREALDFVRRQKDNPFFLYLAYNAPHAPLQAPSNELAKFAHIQNEKRRTYAAMVGVMDRGVGQLLDLLDELKLADDTLIFFLSDNGGPLKDNGSSNGKLRAGKSSPYEGGFRVPFVVRWPGKIPSGVTYAQPVSSLDIFATMAALNQLAPAPERPLDGVNLVPFLRGENPAAPHERIYLRMFDQGRYAMREGDFKLVKNGPTQPDELYNLAEDISEKNDLAAAQPERLARLQAVYQAWNAQLIEPTFPGLKMSEWATPQPPATEK